jgi:hypothetical protein
MTASKLRRYEMRRFIVIALATATLEFLHGQASAGQSGRLSKEDACRNFMVLSGTELLDTSIVQAWIKRGLDVKTCQDAEGNTALMKAAAGSNFHVNIIQLLFASEVDASIQNKHGETALSLAQKRLRDARATAEKDARLLQMAEKAVWLLQLDGPPRDGIGATSGPEYRTGTATLMQTWAFDFDRGATSDSRSGVWFQAETPTERYLTGAISFVGDRSIGRDGCKTREIPARNRVPIESFQEGSYACFRTPAGRYGEFQIKSGAGPSPGAITFAYTVWN